MLWLCREHSLRFPWHLQSRQRSVKWRLRGLSGGCCYSNVVLLKHHDHCGAGVGVKCSIWFHRKVLPPKEDQVWCSVLTVHPVSACETRGSARGIWSEGLRAFAGAQVQEEVNDSTRTRNTCSRPAMCSGHSVMD